MIKIQRKIQFHNDCGALVNYEELEKAVLWYFDYIYDNPELLEVTE